MAKITRDVTEKAKRGCHKNCILANILDIEIGYSSSDTEYVILYNEDKSEEVVWPIGYVIAESFDEKTTEEFLAIWENVTITIPLDVRNAIKKLKGENQ